jgi:hypothetical protein
MEDAEKYVDSLYSTEVTFKTQMAEDIYNIIKAKPKEYKRPELLDPHRAQYRWNFNGNDWIPDIVINSKKDIPINVYINCG